jgi:transcriptional regulator with XRE-family HTH domain
MADTRLSKTLREARLKRSLTQAQVAQEAEVSTNWYARYERGEEPASFKTTEKIFKVLGLKMPAPFN